MAVETLSKGRFWAVKNFQCLLGMKGSIWFKRRDAGQKFKRYEKDCISYRLSLPGHENGTAVWLPSSLLDPQRNPVMHKKCLEREGVILSISIIM